jgi:purine-nucleoside phosphorylase
VTDGWNDPDLDRARQALGTEWEGAEVAAVFGSGLGAGARDVRVVAELDYAQVPGLGACGVPGHAGRLIRGRLAAREIVLFQGRRHLYEGLSMAAVAFPARLARALGAKLLVLFSAVGGCRPGLDVGAWVFIEDHLNLMGRNPLEGVRTDRGPAFVDLSRAYRVDLYGRVHTAVAPRGVSLGRGVLGAFPGPTYETPAEVRMAQALGAAVVGMSIVPEAVWARFLGLDVLAFGCVTNPAAGVGDAPIDHTEVLARSGERGREAAALLEESVRAWGEQGPQGEKPGSART